MPFRSSVQFRSSGVQCGAVHTKVALAFGEIPELRRYGTLPMPTPADNYSSSGELAPHRPAPLLRPAVLPELRFPFPRNSRAPPKNFTSRGISAGIPRVFRGISVPWS